MPKIAYASLSNQLPAAGDAVSVLLVPMGHFAASDGRPGNMEGVTCQQWLLTPERAQQIAATFNARATKLMFDYEHGMITLKGKGVPVPASGWGGGMVVKDDGLYADPVEWTAKAAAMIAAKEILYTSPVFSFDKATGEVLGVQMCAITNDPALDGLPELQVALSKLTFEGNSPMDELLERLRWFLNLPTTATAEEILVELGKLKDMLSQEAQAAASFDLASFITKATADQAQVVALSAQVANPDPAKYVPLSSLEAAHARIATLQGQVTTGNVETMIASAMKEGRLLGEPDVEWARSFAKQYGEDQLQVALSKRPAIPALSGMQTLGKPPEKAGTVALSQEQRDAARLLGYSETDYAALVKA